MIQLKNITGGYKKDSNILQGIDLCIEKGEVVGIIGLNGCGKSTLGKALLNLIPYRGGSMSMDGDDISRLQTPDIIAHGVRMVMQGGRIFRNMSIEEQLIMASGAKNKKNLKEKLEELENLYKISNFVEDLPMGKSGSFLSGGQKQILALIMALMNKPDYLVLDELSAGLSPANKGIVTDMVEHLKSMKKIGIMLIEQNLKMAASLSDRLLLMERGIIAREWKIDSSFDISELNEDIFN